MRALLLKRKSKLLENKEFLAELAVNGLQIDEKNQDYLVPATLQLKLVAIVTNQEINFKNFLRKFISKRSQVTY